MFTLYKVEVPNSPKDPYKFLPVGEFDICAEGRREMNRRNAKGEKYALYRGRELISSTV